MNFKIYLFGYRFTFGVTINVSRYIKVNTKW